LRYRQRTRLNALLALIATPFAQAVFCAAFALERDRLYIGFTAAVPAVLFYGVCTALMAQVAW
jgi:uncharacterized membrane protein